MSITGVNIPAFVRGLPSAEAIGGLRGVKQSTNNITGLAIELAPSSGRSDGLKGHITSRKVDRKTYQVYVSPIHAWPAYSPNSSNVSRMAARIYPRAQERGYRPHWVHTQMMPPEVRGKYEKGMGPRRIFARKFTPYMLPAYLRTMIKNQKEMQKELNREMNKLKKRSKIGKISGAKLAGGGFAK